jgi:pimeloyl-ACP methyl ester carboxylesterase
MSRVVLVHGAWHGAWCWDRLVPLLESAGHTVEAVDLPSAGAGGDLAADTAVLRAAIDRSSDPTVVVAHSYGGIPTTQATAGASQVRHLVYLCAFLLDEGESLLGALQGQTPPWIEVDEANGVSRVPDPVPVFYADVEPAAAEAYAARLAPQTLSSFADPLTAAGWHDLASTYVLCTDDQAIPFPAQQAMSARAGTVHTLQSSHSPFVSHAEEVAAIIDGVAG